MNNYIYYTKYGKEKPYKIVMEDNRVAVYTGRQYNTFVLDSVIESIFLGKNSDDAFIGNSILLNLGNHHYVFIGSIVYSFKAHGLIIDFVSSVGNNGISFPFAIDEHGNRYLMVNCVVKNWNKDEYIYNDPYNDYYRRDCDDKYHDMDNLSLIHRFL